MATQARPRPGRAFLAAGRRTGNDGMRDDDTDRYNRGVLLALFVGAIAASIVIVACLGWGSTVLP